MSVDILLKKSMNSIKLNGHNKIQRKESHYMMRMKKSKSNICREFDVLIKYYISEIHVTKMAGNI